MRISKEFEQRNKPETMKRSAESLHAPEDRIASAHQGSAESGISKRSIANHLQGDRRPLLEVALIAFGRGGADADAREMRYLIDAARVRVNGEIDRKVRNF